MSSRYINNIVTNSRSSRSTNIFNKLKANKEITSE